MSTKLIASLCPYCAVGCGLYLEVDKGIAKGIEYMTDHPACEGALRPKGNALLEILNHVERLKYPEKGWRRFCSDPMGRSSGPGSAGAFQESPQARTKIPGIPGIFPLQ